MDIDKQALQYVFPGELLDHFDIESAQVNLDKPTQEEYLEVVFTEKNVLPEGYSQKDYESKGFFTKVVQDFPLRGRAVFLKVRRRRWRHKQTGEQITRDFSFLAQGSKFTAELAAFLKERG